VSELPKPVMNIADVPMMDWGNGKGFQAQFGSFSHLIGSKPMGVSLTVVEPGQKAFPMHNHHVTAEMFFIVEGEGTYRVGENSYPVAQGDVIAAPPGGPETAHQISNTGSQTLRYLSFSANPGDTDVTEYPESGKFATMSRFNRVTREGGVRFIGKVEDGRDYWEGEE
jgi:uncharacterized cupin superfamily protein